MRRHRLVSALFAAQWFEAVRLLPHCFWHNNTCSGFHPPASVMKLLSPTQHKRLNEATGFLLLFAGMVTLLSLISYHVQDPSWNTAASSRPLNLIGYPGAYLSDLCLQVFGASAFLFPLLLFGLAWKWIRSDELHAGAMKIAGAVLLSLAASAALSFLPLRLFGGTVRMGGTIGLALATSLVDALNLAGALLVTATALVISLYLVSSFALAATRRWFEGPAAVLRRFALAWRLWRERRHARAVERARLRAARRALAAKNRADAELNKKPKKAKPATVAAPAMAAAAGEGPPWPTGEPASMDEPARFEAVAEIPICPIEDLAPEPAPALVPPPTELPLAPPEPRRLMYDLPSTELLNEVPGRSPYDEQELKDTAGRIKAKYEEFNVLGNVVQINPGPVVTTFEFKPEAGIKYSRITTLSEDLCLGLQAESILIERIPGKPTVGIEVPNARRELISIRQILESEEFNDSNSRLTICLGKDISGRIKVAALESMPHLLIAGSTGAGKSVMLNSMIMSILYKATPDEVRMILVDPKRLEMGLYEGIPHLLTPVITDAKKATNALRNAVLEMERRLKLLAGQGVRNIDQYNRKMRQLQNEPRSLFDEEEPMTAADLRPLPYILILIDELADLMMVERGNVEEAVTRLAQMARAVGMHLVLATQRPSGGVITGLIKANFPSRISFRVATRVDSRTVLDIMGAEHLLGKGDMLFLP